MKKNKTLWSKAMYLEPITDSDLRNFQKDLQTSTEKSNAYGLILVLHGLVLCNEKSNINRLCKEVRKNPILSKNPELTRRIDSGLTKKDLNFLKDLYTSLQ